MAQRWNRLLPLLTAYAVSTMVGNLEVRLHTFVLR